MTDQPVTTKKQRTTKPKPTYITAKPGDKEVLSPAGQDHFSVLFSSLNPMQQKAVVTVLDEIASGVLLAEGYRKFFRFWREFRKNIGIKNAKF